MKCCCDALLEIAGAISSVPLNMALPAMDFSSGTTAIALIAAIPIAYYLILPSILDLLTPKPLPGIPYRKGRQYPLIGDGLDAGKWYAAQMTITQWLDGCAKAFIYGGKDLGAEWGVLDGKKTTQEQLDQLTRPGRKRSEEYEGISQLMFGFGHGNRQVIVTDVEGMSVSHASWSITPY